MKIVRFFNDVLNTVSSLCLDAAGLATIVIIAFGLY